MRNPWSGGFTDRAEWQFKTCARNDGSYYGTADGNKCRIGTEASLPEKGEKVKKLLSGSFDEYESSYGKIRDGIIQDSAETQANRILDPDIANKKPDDARARLAAKRTVLNLEEIDEYRAAGNETSAIKLETKKELYDDMKWLLVNDRLLVSEGTLNEAWNGTNLSEKANKFYDSNKFGQSRVVVAEHPVPSHALKTELIRGKERDLKSVTTTIVKKSLISLTSAKEDDKINSGGFKSEMPDPSKSMSRYERGKVKTFVLDKKLGKGNNPGRVTTAVQKSAAAAKEKKMSKEEWIASIIEGMENM